MLERVQGPMFRDDFSALLKKHVMDVIFRKNDGTQRRMKCTLLSRYLPVQTERQKYDAHRRPRKEPSPDSIRVWDIDKGAWRAFKIDAVTHTSINQ